MSSGTLRVQTFAARLSAPVGDVSVTVVGDGVSNTFTTDSSGNAPVLSLAAPDQSYSLDEDNTTVRPYSVYNVTARKDGYQLLELIGVQLFDGQETLAQLVLTPTDAPDGREGDPVFVPEAGLWAGTGGSGPAPVTDPDAIPDPGTGLILDQVVIPKTITVHLGTPSSNARNVTVDFLQYVANVASSEIYPTWPRQALLANMHAQVSLALNRIYTEWYPSRGYSYNITNSTSYDQYFVYQRPIFAIMEQLASEVFNTYVQKGTGAEPYYTEYCDGKSVSCPGLKQWGTVTLANQGRSALQILRYYYGNDVRIVQTSNIAAIPQSYPGAPLRRGDRGTSVSVLQRQLNRIARDYPGIGKLTVDGNFGTAMEDTVRKFQRQFNLTADGVVGKSTWYKISYIYASVKDLAELTSEGEEQVGSVSGGNFGGTTLRQGSSGTSVEQVQFWLNYLAQFNAALPAVTVDGVFGPATTTAVTAFQRQQGLTQDGAVGRATWDALYTAYQSAASDVGAVQYPGSVIKQGDSGAAVRQVQFWLSLAADQYSALVPVSVDGVFGAATARAVTAFQNFFSLTADGRVGSATWNALSTLGLEIVNGLLAPNQRPGTYPGRLAQGSTGQPVRELQYYLYILSAYYSNLPEVSIDGQFGADTTAAVRAWQTQAGLTVDGIVGPTTWESLVAAARAAQGAGAVTRLRSLAWPGSILSLGSTGDAVSYALWMLSTAAFYDPAVEDPGTGDTYTQATARSVSSFQQQNGLPVTGSIDRATWDALQEKVDLYRTTEPSSGS